jgi:hypothetical protein
VEILLTLECTCFDMILIRILYLVIRKNMKDNQAKTQIKSSVQQCFITVPQGTVTVRSSMMKIC